MNATPEDSPLPLPSRWPAKTPLHSRPGADPAAVGHRSVGGVREDVLVGAAMTAVGLFAGIGGVEEGLRSSGAADAELLVENWLPAQAVLRHRFPDAKLDDDVAAVTSLPKVDLLAAGFPCTDLSQAGRTAGITGRASGLVAHVFRLLEDADPTWLVLENVRNMLVLDQGHAMHYLVEELETRGYRWAYRLVDSRFTGVPQRRQRVILAASRTEDPAAVLLADDAGEPPVPADYAAAGFYWTEGLRGLGWAPDAVPTLKGGSTIGIPSPPAIWVPGAEPGRRIVVPAIEDAEALQGFDRGWTDVDGVGSRKGNRWRMVGNAVTVGVSQWLGRRLLDPGQAHDRAAVRVEPGARWPLAAYGSSGQVWASAVSMWPLRTPSLPILDVVDVTSAPALSAKATAGFASRMAKSSLRFDPAFRADIEAHAQHMATAAQGISSTTAPRRAARTPSTSVTTSAVPSEVVQLPREELSNSR